MKKLLVCFVALTLFLSSCRSDVRKNQDKTNATQIYFSDAKITIDGQEITGDATQAVYSANDIVFYLAGQDFTYGEGEKQDEHEQSEADAHTVVHITKPGNYVLNGKLSLGQIAVDLGEDAENDPDAVVTLVLNDVDITCKVAPAVIFYNVYECCNRDEDTATKDVDTSKAGANVLIVDGTENNINGSYVAKIYKSVELSEDGKEIVDSKKLHKYDGAFYSQKTMNICGGDKGTGILNINAENEGLDSELHLTINGGIINIKSGNDGINTNEDNVSVTTMNGGTLNIICDGSTGEGDGIDSNGWLVINGGTIIAQACSSSGDAGIDSDKGIYINGGNVIASGNMVDYIAGGNQTYAVFNFANRQNGNETYTLKNSAGRVVGEYAPDNGFTYLIIAGNELIPGNYTFWKGAIQLSGSKTQSIGGGMPHGQRPQIPNEDQGSPPEIPEDDERHEKSNGEIPKGERPEMPNEGMPDAFTGERPEMPEGMMPPDNEGGTIVGNMMQSKEITTTFTITMGGNNFSSVAQAAS